MSETDPSDLADRREREADDLQDRSDRLKGEIDDAREDWQRKRADESIPGAPAPEGSSEDQESEGEKDSESDDTKD